MVQSEDGRFVFEGICEDGRATLNNTLLEDGRIITIIPIFSSDAGTGADVSFPILAAILKAEAGTGADEKLALLATWLRTDAGAGVDQLGELTILCGETGVGADVSFPILAALLKTETGAGIDTMLQLLIEWVSSDTGTGADQLEVLSLLCVDAGYGRESVSMCGLSSYGGPAGIDVAFGLNLTEYMPLVTSIDDADANVGEMYIDSLGLNSFRVYNSGLDVSCFRWTVLDDLHDNGESVFGGPGGRTITHAKGDTEYIPCIVASANGNGEIGEWWIADIASNSFVVRNSGRGVSAFRWGIPKYDLEGKGDSAFASSGGRLITHNLNIAGDYTPVIVPTSDPNGQLGAIYITDITANSFRVCNTGKAVSDFLWVIWKNMPGILAAILKAEEGAGADVISTLIAAKLAMETGVGAELAKVLLSSEELGAGQDAILTHVNVLLGSDVGAGVDMLLALLILCAEEGAGTDAIETFLAEILQAETGVGLGEVANILAAIVSAEVGAGTDVSVRLGAWVLLKLLQEYRVSIMMTQKGRPVNIGLSQEVIVN